MTSSITLRSWCMAVLLVPTLVAQSPSTPAAPLLDPLAVGKAAYANHHYEAAQTFFLKYLQANPTDPEATFLEGDTELMLKHFKAAEDQFNATIRLNPKASGGYTGLVIAYAGEGNWSAFDAQRTRIAAMRAANDPGAPDLKSNIIEFLDVGGEQWIAREFYDLEGRYHLRYNFYHLGANDQPTGWIQCESDDVDQRFFAQSHPAEAAAGKHSFSLDSYSPVTTLPNGSRTQTHGTLKLYSNGEPTYETVRADVIAALSHETAPISSSTSHQ